MVRAFSAGNRFPDHSQVSHAKYYLHTNSDSYTTAYAYCISISTRTSDAAHMRMSMTVRNSLDQLDI